MAMKSILLFIPLILTCIHLSGQNVPSGMRYQAVVRDTEGAILTNEIMRARVELLSMEGNPEVFYEEIHDVQINEFGLLNLTIGQGKPLKGEFESIPWARKNIWIRTSLKRQHSATYDITTTDQLYSVPYAQYARSAGRVESLHPEMDLRSLFQEISPYWSITGNKYVEKIHNPPTLGTLDASPIIIVTNDTARMTIAEDGQVQIIGPLSIDDNVTIGQNLNIHHNLFVDSSITVNEHIYVNGNGIFGGNLKIDSTLVVGGEIMTEGNTLIGGHLKVDSSLMVGQDMMIGGNGRILGQLQVDSNLQVDKDVVIHGTTALKDSLRVFGPVTFNIDVEGLQTEQMSYPVLIKGSKQGLAIDLTPATEDCLTSHRGNNYISFWRDGIQKGRIEGMGRADLDPTGMLGMLLDIFSDPSEVSNSLGGIFTFDIASPFVNFGTELLNIIEFSPGSLPTLSNGQLPSLSEGSLPSYDPPLDFNPGSFPSLDAGSFPVLSPGSLPGISFNTPMFSNPFENSELENTFEELFNNFNAVNTSDVGCIIENTSPAQNAWSIMRAALLDADLYPPQADATDFESQIFSNYTLDVLLGGISTLSSAVTFFSSLGSVLDPEDIFAQGVDLLSNLYSLVIYGSYSDINVGVAYESGAGDYAEWLLRADPEELIQPGDVVGVIGGKVSKKFMHADRFMVVSTSPLLLGNMPANSSEEKFYEKIAFVGQVPVKVIGEVEIGDYILPSGQGDGFAIAIHPSKMLARDYQRIIGIAWEKSQGGDYAQLINTAVGINHNDMAKTIEQMQFTLNHIQAHLKKLDPNFQPHEYEVSIGQFGENTLEYSVAPTNLVNHRDYFKDKKYESQSQLLSDVRERIVENAGVDLASVPLLDFAFKNPHQAKCLASEYRLILDDMIQIKNKLLEPKIR